MGVNIEVLRYKRGIASSLLIGVLFGSLLFVPLTASPTFPGTNGKIAFHRNVTGVSGGDEIFIMDSDGMNEKQLTSNLVDDRAPSWSPDATKIAFQRLIGSFWEIVIMELDLSLLPGDPVVSETQVTTTNSFHEISPQWSPNGSDLVIGSNRDGGGDLELFLMACSFSPSVSCSVAASPLNVGNSVDDIPMDWNPVGSEIVFQRRTGISWDLHKINSSTSVETPLTSDPTRFDGHASWSPDGSRIAFDSERDVQFKQEIYVMNSDGSSPDRLTFDGVNNQRPSFSPDGSKIAFRKQVSTASDREIYVMPCSFSGTPSCGTQTQLTSNSVLDDVPDWGVLSVSGPVGGEIIPIHMTSLMVAGVFANAYWILPMVGGAAGALIAVAKVRRAKTEEK